MLSQQIFSKPPRRTYSIYRSDFVYLVLNGTSTLFRQLVPRIVEIKHTRHVKNDLRMTSSSNRNNVNVDIIDKHK